MYLICFLQLKLSKFTILWRNYFFLDSLTKEKLIFVGQGSTFIDIENVIIIIKAEEFIFQNPDEKFMVW